MQCILDRLRREVQELKERVKKTERVTGTETENAAVLPVYPGLV